MAEATLYVDGMSNERTAGAVTDALIALQGVSSVIVDIDKKKARVSFDPKRVQPERMRWAVRQEGIPERPRM